MAHSPSGCDLVFRTEHPLRQDFQKKKVMHVIADNGQEQGGTKLSKWQSCLLKPLVADRQTDESV